MRALALRFLSSILATAFLLPAGAEDLVLPLVPADALLPTNSDAYRKAVQGKSYGAVSMREVSFASRVNAEASAVEAVQQHAEHYTFFVVPVSFGILGVDGAKCKALQLSLAVRAPRLQATDVYVIDVFPRSELKLGQVSADASLNVEANLKFAPIPATAPIQGSLGVDGKAGVKFGYAPMFQRTAAVFDQSKVIWRFEKVGQDFPVGQADVHMLLAVAKSATKQKPPTVFLDFEIRAEFGTSWFGNDIVTQSGTISIRFP